MDFTPLIKLIAPILIYLVPILILAGIIKSSWFKGMMGESLINISVRWLLDKDKYHLIKNVLIPTEDGTTQIDHIIVSMYGVFVVETKNMKGWIFGGKKEAYWTQKIYKHTNKFQNPLRQNYKHTKTLESLLNLNSNQIHSIIVFVGDSTFKTDMPENVTYGSGYAKYIKSKKDKVLTESQLSEIIKKIDEGKIQSSIKSNYKHIKHVKALVKERDREPSKVTNVLIHKIHGGRKKDSKFWNDDIIINDGDKSDKTSKKNRRQSTLDIISKTALLCLPTIILLIVFKPSWFQFLDNHSIYNTLTGKSNNSEVLNETFKNEVQPKRVHTNNKRLNTTLISTRKPLSANTPKENQIRYARERFPKAETIYCWTDKEGHLSFSNTGFPNNADFTPKWVKSFK